MASVPKLLLLSLLFFLSCYRSHIAHAGDDGSYKVLSIGSQSLRTNKSVCSESKAAVRSSSGAATVPLHHRHGPCSPLPTNKMPTLEERLHRDQLRAAYIQRKLSGGVKKGGRGGAGGDVQQSHAATVPTTLGTSLNTLEYLITVRLGSPGKSQTMFIDTGSDVSWVQCKPCWQCHSQVDPLFDPSSSSTYSPFSCSSAACAQLGQEGNGNGCSTSQCQYIVRYGDGSVGTTGTYSSDTLALGSNTVVRNFRFGCSHVESGFRDNDQTDGLMGLGGGAQSLVSQTAGRFGGTAFSYCLPPTPSSSGFLTLGAAGTSSGFVKTPMLRSRQVPTFYGVRLEAIRVGGRQLSIPTSVFSAGMIMDSGTVLTRLPPTAYSALSSAFKAGMKRYPPAPPSGILDTCFDFSGQSSVSIPTVALVFTGGAVVNLDANGIMLQTSSSILCLAFAANSDDSPGIIGNVQQRTFEVLYDVRGGAVGFKAGAC
ncbi:aspartyl protease family protein At5g10770-like [Miscanthus floridulus]|uniref:aspartyl protease family protein At5g10770-like n=1 Tax=Miscanthus floridulus TaxID=154761 RepID=UPI0034582FD7